MSSLISDASIASSLDDDDCCDCFLWNYFTTICATHNIWKLPSATQVDKNQGRPSRLTLFCNKVAELSLKRNGEETRSACNPCLEISPFRLFVTHGDRGIGHSSSWIWLFDCVWKYVSSTRTLPASISNMYNWHYCEKISTMTLQQYCNTLIHRNNKSSRESKRAREQARENAQVAANPTIVHQRAEERRRVRWEKQENQEIRRFWQKWRALAKQSDNLRTPAQFLGWRKWLEEHRRYAPTKI